MSAIATKVMKIVAQKLGIHVSELSYETSFKTDLGVNSIDAVELVMEFEREFNVSIPEEQAEKIRIIGDAISYFEKKSN